MMDVITVSPFSTFATIETTFMIAHLPILTGNSFYIFCCVLTHQMRLPLCFFRMVGACKPEDSWVCKWQRIGKYLLNQSREHSDKWQIFQFQFISKKVSTPFLFLDVSQQLLFAICKLTQSPTETGTQASVKELFLKLLVHFCELTLFR